MGFPLISLSSNDIDMIELEIAKTTNLILCCAPGSDSKRLSIGHVYGADSGTEDISIEDTEFSLIQKHDPEAKRSICKFPLILPFQ